MKLALLLFADDVTVYALPHDRLRRA